MEFSVQIGVGALFKCITHKGDSSSPTNETPMFPNLVLDTGLNRMSVGVWMDRICVGTGNSTPVGTQTALDAYLTSTTTVLGTDAVGVNTVGTPYYYLRRTWRFNPRGSSANISELGLGWANTNLWNRALIKDTSGNPITITWAGDEYLDIVSEIRHYMPTEVSGSFPLYDKFGSLISTHTYTGKPYLNAGYIQFNTAQVKFDTRAYVTASAMPSAYTDYPTGGAYSAGSTVTTTYPDNRSAQGKLTLGLTEFNGVAMRTFACALLNFLTANSSISPGYKWEISPTITKTSAQSLEANFLIAWSRYTP
ncbi:hypothetical protein F966_03621 [Acinetobacter higginsii]|uniref:Uncharacterized protein n=1 Tax=Acinetobacter higginsii TaxID=70347 RepID=N8XF74_9GAMM|nr:hypothetical protein [Acinetobacter higginsii]ENV07764.1 hypothetical protein F966_03621 [Acinetobacter higginsii]